LNNLEENSDSLRLPVFTPRKGHISPIFKLDLEDEKTPSSRHSSDGLHQKQRVGKPRRLFTPEKEIIPRKDGGIFEVDKSTAKQ